MKPRKYPECSACIAESDGRYEWQGYPLCAGCHPAPETPWKPLQVPDAVRLREAILQKAELVRPAVEALLGIPYNDLGPPRLTHGWEAFDREVARQDRLVAAGLQRRGRSTQGGSCTLAWDRFSSGRFGWCGNNCGIPGGTWPSPDDYDKAWQAGRQPSWSRGSYPRGSARADRSPAASGGSLRSFEIIDDDLEFILNDLI